jgi:hypothetical protein
MRISRPAYGAYIPFRDTEDLLFLCKAIKCMKLTSFFLFVATGLILCATLHAQQYHDAAAFGLKGNVKECKVVDAKDGSASYDPHLFSTVSFTREGKLVSWFEDSRNARDLVLCITDVIRDKNQQPLLFELKESSYRTKSYFFPV